MLHYLLDYLYRIIPTLDNVFARLFNYLSIRSALALLISLLITVYFGKTIIKFLSKKLVEDQIRDLGLKGQVEKRGTPTMGGVIILLGVLIPTLLLCQLDNIYVIILLITIIWLGFIGFIDDYIKVFKNNKKGLAGKFKIIGQCGLGLIVASILFFHPGVIIQENINDKEIAELISNQKNHPDSLEKDIIAFQRDSRNFFGDSLYHSLKTTIPFFKNNQLDYKELIPDSLQNPWVIFMVFSFIIIFIITAVSNSANLTDGIDGLATGSSAIIGATLGVFCYISGNMVAADYLDIMYISDIGELVVLLSAFVGACVGFLWYNSYPAQVFMGDTGSLALGGIIGVVAVLIRKELLIPIFCGIFFIESLSVILQVSYFKFTKYKFGVGRRIFLMSPLHHHYQKKGIHESKIVTRFWIVCVFLCVLAFVTLKLR